MNRSLIDFKPGDKVKIQCLDCGRCFQDRLRDLGLHDGAEITVVKNDLAGPIIIKIYNSKMAIGRGEASKIYAKKA